MAGMCVITCVYFAPSYKLLADRRQLVLCPLEVTRQATFCSNEDLISKSGYV